MTSIAAVIIAGGKRGRLLDQLVIPSVLVLPFDEVIVAGEHHAGEGYRYLHIPAMTRTTNDALVKRDAGTAATKADLILYLCDDHAVLGGIQEVKDDPGVSPWDVIVPQRYADHPEHGRIRINNGESEGYCGGHGGLFRRRVIQDRPWTAMPHHRLWDLYASRAQQQAGFHFVGHSHLAILDLEPEASPWR